MKKTFLLLLLLTSALLICLTACGGESKDHEHSFGEWRITRTATCEEQGERVRTCSCDETESEPIPATGHAWSVEDLYWEWDGNTANAVVPCKNDTNHVQKSDAEVTGEVTKEPTETENGMMTYTARVVINGVEYTSQNMETIPKKGSTSSDEFKFVDYDEFRTEFYTMKYIDFYESLGPAMVNEIQGSDLIMGTVIAWETVHFVEESPLYDNGELTRKDLYMLVLYDILTGNLDEIENANPLDFINENTNNFFYSAAKFVFGEDGVFEISEKVFKNKMTASGLFTRLDFVEDIIKLMDNQVDALNKCIYCEEIGKMDASFKQIFQYIAYEPWIDSDLRAAAREYVDIIDKAGKAALDEYTSDIMAGNSAEYLKQFIADEVWDLVCKKVPVIEAAQITTRGVTVLCDSIFNMDTTTKNYFRLKACAEIEMALRAALTNEDIYTDMNYASEYAYALDVFEKCVRTGYIYSEKLLINIRDALVTSSEDKEYINELLAKIDELEATQEKITKQFDSTCKALYEKYVDLELFGDTPVKTALIYLRVNDYTGTYVGPQGVMGADLSIYIKDELLGDTETLEEYARYATEYSTDENGVVQKTYTVDEIKEIIKRHDRDYVAIVRYYPTAENPDVESGLYTLDVYYDPETGYELIGAHWIQHYDYVFADFRNMTDFGKMPFGGIVCGYMDTFMGPVYYEYGEATFY